MIKLQKIVMFFSFLLISACATKKPHIDQRNLSESQVDISYMLGHSSYRYRASSKKETAEIASYRDQSLLEKRTIPMETYKSFMKKVEEALQKSNASSGPPTQEELQGCRTAYSVSVKTKQQKMAMSGCRSEDTEGFIGQLIKEGEFLMYSNEIQK